MSQSADQPDASPRYVVQHHTGHGADHYDLMIERDGALWTWRIERSPADGPLDAVRIADHRLHYLDYEGPVSGDRGRVRIADRGRAEWLVASDGFVRVRLADGRCAGAYELRLIDSADGVWRLTPEGRPDS